MTLQQASSSRTRRDETGVIPRLARAAREVESSVQRRAASRTGRTKLQTVAILVREERARIKGDDQLSPSKRAEELKRLDGIALILAKSASRDPTLLPLLGEGAPMTDAVRNYKREVLQAAGIDPEPEPEPEPVEEQEAPEEAAKRVIPPSVAASQLARPFSEPDMSGDRRKPQLDRLAGFDLLEPLFQSFEFGADGRPACMELPEAGDLGTGTGTDLMPHQARLLEAVRRGHRSVLLADEPGLGKTAQALLSAQAAQAYPLLVVAPNVVKTNWAREARRWTPGRSVTVVQGDGHTVDGFADIVIVNYEVLDRHVGWMAKHGFKGMVLDEAHFIKNEESKRSKHVLRISQSIRHRNARALMMALTGTPLINDIEDFRMIWRFLGWIDAKRPNAELVERLEAIELTPLDGTPFFREARRAVIDMGIVRRRKQDVAADIPARNVFDFEIALDDEAARSVLELQDRITTSLLQRYLSAAERNEVPRDEIDERLVDRVVRVTLDESDGSDENVFTLVRRIGVAKATQSAEYTAQLARISGKVVYFAKHIDVMDTAERYFSAHGIRHTSIRGDQTPKQRQEAIDSFVNDEGVQVIVCSLQAAGVGINLQVASELVLAELPWTNAEQTQAIDRVHRIGQSTPVNAWRILAANTRDVRVARIVDEKENLAARALDGAKAVRKDDEDDTSSVRTMQEEMLKALLRDALAQQRSSHTLAS